MKTHQPCPDCGSSDALTDYGDHTFCFACNKYQGESEVTISGSLIPLGDLQYKNIQARNLCKETCRKFTYGIHNNLQVATYWHNGRPLFQKTRSQTKDFKVLKADEPEVQLKQLLFGRQVWGDNGGTRLIITEGEIDCLTAHEALGGLGYHSVSVPCGVQGALDTIKLNLDWIDRYAEVYLGFDNDEPGQKAANEVCQQLGLKFQWINIPQGIKDINDLWLAGGRQAILEAVQTAKSWKPSGIIGVEDFHKILAEKPKRGIEWPWATLNRTTYGIRPGLILVTAGSGVGKTTWFKQVEAHCYASGHKIGVIHLEESAANTINGLLTLLTGRPFHIPDNQIDPKFHREMVDQLVQERRLVLFDKSIGFDEDIILSNIRYMVQGLGCSVVFLDHLTAITDQYDKDVNQKTRNLIVKLGKLVTTLDFPLLAISHLRKSDGKPHEEGGRVHLDDMLGAGAIKQWAEHVYALERDNQNEDPQARNRPVLRDLKNRPLGEYTGTVVPLVYDSVSFTLKEGDPFETPKNTGAFSSTPSDF